MKEQGKWMDRILGKTDLTVQSLPGLPVVEVYGHTRVLIENHQGVTEYGPEKICVCVKFGWVKVSGTCLQLANMTKGQVVICGNIVGVELLRMCI